MLTRLFLNGFVLLMMMAVPSFAQQGAVRARGMTYNGTNTKDLIDLRNLGANIVSYQLVWPGGPADAATVEDYEAWLDGRLQILDTLVDEAATKGLFVLIQLYTPPGGFSSYGYPAQHRLFSSLEFQSEFIHVWQTIAQRYKGKQGIWGYDLLNEPAERSVRSGIFNWNDLSRLTFNAIREIDSDTRVVIESAYGNPDLFRRLQPIHKAGVVYNFHAYYPEKFRTQGFYGRPARVVYPFKRFNHTALEKSVRRAKGFQRKSRAPMLVGEFSAPRWAPDNSAYRYLRDYIKVFERAHWSWVYHGWREDLAWSIEHSTIQTDLLKTLRPTNREVLLASFFARNR